MLAKPPMGGLKAPPNKERPKLQQPDFTPHLFVSNFEFIIYCRIIYIRIIIFEIQAPFFEIGDARPRGDWDWRTKGIVRRGNSDYEKLDVNNSRLPTFSWLQDHDNLDHFDVVEIVNYWGIHRARKCYENDLESLFDNYSKKNSDLRISDLDWKMGITTFPTMRSSRLPKSLSGGIFHPRTTLQALPQSMGLPNIILQPVLSRLSLSVVNRVDYHLPKAQKSVPYTRF